MQETAEWNGTQAVPYEMDEPCAVQPTAKLQVARRRAEKSSCRGGRREMVLQKGGGHGQHHGGEHIGHLELFAPHQVDAHAENQDGANHGKV